MLGLERIRTELIKGTPNGFGTRRRTDGISDSDPRGRGGIGCGSRRRAGGVLFGLRAIFGAHV